MLAAGDKVMFQPISLREYHSLAAQEAEGTLDLAPVEAWTGAAA